MKLDLNSLFQNQPWYIKLWRYRHYLSIPYYTIKYRYFSNMADKNWEHAFGIAIGGAHMKMNWLHIMEEVTKFLESDKKINEHDV